MLCDYERLNDKKVRCKACRRTVTFSGDVRYLCGECKRKGFGDYLAKFFKWLGIRRKPMCGCHKRQHAVNRWFRWPF